MKYASQKKRSKMSINSPQKSKKLKDIAINQIAEEPPNGKKLIGDLTGFFSTRIELFIALTKKITLSSFITRKRTMVTKGTKGIIKRET